MIFGSSSFSMAEMIFNSTALVFMKISTQNNEEPYFFELIETFLEITDSASFILLNIKSSTVFSLHEPPMLLYFFQENNVIEDFTWELLILRK